MIAARHNGVSSRVAVATKPDVPASDAGGAGVLVDPSNWLQGLVILPPLAQITADARPPTRGKATASAPSQLDPASTVESRSARRADSDPHPSSPAQPPSAAASPFAAAGSTDPDPAPSAVPTDVGRGDEGAAAAAVAQLALRARGPSSRDSEAESSMVSEELDSRTSSVSSATGSLTSAGRSGSPGWPPSASTDRSALPNGAAVLDPPLRRGASARSDADLDEATGEEHTGSPSASAAQLRKARRELSFSPGRPEGTRRHGDGDSAAPDTLRPSEPAPAEPLIAGLQGSTGGGDAQLGPGSPAPDVGSHPVDDGFTSDVEDGRDTPSTPLPAQKQATVPLLNGVDVRSPSFTPGDEDLPQGEWPFVELSLSLDLRCPSEP